MPIPSLDKTQKLDEVVIKANLEKIRIEDIKNKAPYSRIHVISEMQRKLSLNITDFINGKNGFIAGVDPASNTVWVKLRNPLRSINGGQKPTIFLDGAQLFDFNLLFNIDISIVDYIDLNPSGIGEGIRGGTGTIKIFTNPELSRTEKELRKTQEFKFPLTFNTPKEFYVPKYKNYANNFYRDYGTIAWLPVNNANTNGEFSFKLKNYLENNITLFIEGTANDGSYISETKTIIIN